MSRHFGSVVRAKMNIERNQPAKSAATQTGCFRLQGWQWGFLALAALLISAASVAYLPVDDDGAMTAGFQGSGLHSADLDGALRSAEKHRSGVMLLLMAGALSMAAAYFYVRRLHRSLTTLQHAAGRIAAGSLDTDAAAGGVREVAAVGAALNEIAANQQEILLHVWNRAQHSMAVLDGICSRLAPSENTALAGELQRLRGDLQWLRSLGAGAEMYAIRIENGRILSDCEARTGSEAAPSDK